jgi:hypothetical protein
MRCLIACLAIRYIDGDFFHCRFLYLHVSSFTPPPQLHRDTDSSTQHATVIHRNSANHSRRYVDNSSVLQRLNPTAFSMDTPLHILRIRRFYYSTSTTASSTLRASVGEPLLMRLLSGLRTAFLAYIDLFLQSISLIGKTTELAAELNSCCVFPSPSIVVEEVTEE